MSAKLLPGEHELAIYGPLQARVAEIQSSPGGQIGLIPEYFDFTRMSKLEGMRPQFSTKKVLDPYTKSVFGTDISMFLVPMKPRDDHTDNNSAGSKKRRKHRKRKL